MNNTPENKHITYGTFSKYINHNNTWMNCIHHLTKAVQAVEGIHCG